MSNIWDEALDGEPQELQWGAPVPEIVPDETVSNEVLGLLYLGRLTDTFSYQGHTIVIKTLKIGEELEIALLIREFEDTRDANRASITASVAACVETINGQPILPPTLGPSSENLLRRKFDYVRHNWYWPTVAFVYEKYVELLDKQDKALQEFQKKLEASPTS